jgi:uncharacterized protein (TIGR04255 family)
MSKHPTRLTHPPLIEAVFELRFRPFEGRGVELLPGVIMATLGKDFPRLEQTPLSALSKDTRDQRPELKYAPVFRLLGDKEAVLLGDYTASINLTTMKYPGWLGFRSRAMLLASALQASGHIERLERYSLKYLNLIATPASTYPTEPFNLRVEADSYELLPSGFRLRFETRIKDFMNVVEYASGATATIGVEKLQGTLLTIDTIMESANEGFWIEIQQRLDEIHDALEGIFFTQLTNETIEAMGPTYD